MNKETKEIIKEIKKDTKNRKLSKQDKKEYYEAVYQVYGKDIYKKITPKRVQNKDIKNLLKSGKFEDLYYKYGQKTYKDKMSYMKSRDIENETGKKYLGILSRTKDFIKSKVIAPLLGVAIALPAGTITIAEERKI